jgi:hypothetical protein
VSGAFVYLFNGIGEKVAETAKRHYGNIHDPTSNCLGGVQNTLEYVGIKFPRAGAAYQFPSVVKGSNFFDYYEETKWTKALSKLPTGSIIVFDRIDPNSKDVSLRSGHIEIRAPTDTSPNAFISDFVQNNRQTWHGTTPFHIYIPKSD